MKRLLLVLMAVVMLSGCCGALAEDVCTLEKSDEGVDVFTSECFLRVAWEFAELTRVKLTVTGPTGVAYERDYGEREGTFLSEEVYLDAVADQTTYQVVLMAGDTSHIFLVERTDAGNSWETEDYPLGQSR